MGSTLRYLAVDGEDSAIWDWFDRLDPPPTRVPVERGSVLYFRELGPLVYSGAGSVDPAASPVATVIPPRKVRSILWTAGEVHFLATQLASRYPGLNRIGQQFGRWLGQFNRVYPGRPGDWDYYLEGSIRSYDTAVYALPAAMAALERGSYYVSDDDNDDILDALCRKLALRAVTCGDPTRKAWH